MADRIVFNYDKITEVVKKIEAKAKEYETASNDFQKEMASAIANWEGKSKDTFNTYITTKVKQYMGTDIPNMINGIAKLLEENAQAMKDADDQVANNMPTDL